MSDNKPNNKGHVSFGYMPKLMGDFPPFQETGILGYLRKENPKTPATEEASNGFTPDLDKWRQIDQYVSNVVKNKP